jgi:NADP-dependent aldehyde dehydrogenase
LENYRRSLQKMTAQAAVRLEFQGSPANGELPLVSPSIGLVKGTDFLTNRNLQEEVFGPFTLLVTYRDGEELERLVSNVHGQLTASVFGEKEELANWQHVLAGLQKIAGRLIFNGVPTGVEVCTAMQHGGPYPACTDSRFTSVGNHAILRFARPVAYQNSPDELLPDALKNDNPLGIWRMVNGRFSKDKI